MFGTLGGPELLLILVIALIVFGPRKLPEIGKSLGRMMVEFRKATNDFKQTVESEIEADKLRAALEPPRIDPAGSATPVQPAAASEPATAAPPAAEAPAPPLIAEAPGAVSREAPPPVEPK